MSSIKDVAKAAGVSTATVSRVLSGTDYVSKEVTEKVEAAVKELNYRPNRAARSLRTQKSNIVGLVVADIHNPFFSLIGRIVQDVAFENGYNVFLCNTDEDPKKEEAYLKIMRDENASGIIIAPTHQTTQSVENIINLGIPTVLIDRQVENAELDGVFIDNINAAKRLMEHCLQQGYHKIAAIIGGGSKTGKLRYRGMLDALNSHNKSFDKNKVKFIEAHIDDGYRATKELLQLNNQPDALIATNVLLGAGAIKALRELNIPIPEFGFACFDDSVWAPLVNPSVTVMAQPAIEIGRTAMEMLINRINNQNLSYREVILRAELIERESTNRLIISSPVAQRPFPINHGNSVL
ncbi:MAG: LacI family transcriptional regulator [Spirochaetes bacterium]|nr:LacI family transcriptional regulator [Spirochaetota bacterium]